MKHWYLLFALTVGAPAAMADNHASDKPAIAAARVIQFSAEVVAVNQETREVTLKNAAGEEFTMTATPEMRNLAQVEAGDEVLGELIEEVTITLHPNPEGLDPIAAGAALGARAKEGSMPGGVLVDEAVITAVVVAIDLETNTFKLRGPAGNIREFKARDPDNLRAAAIGDLVVITITTALGVVVEHPTAAD